MFQTKIIVFTLIKINFTLFLLSLSLFFPREIQLETRSMWSGWQMWCDLEKPVGCHAELLAKNLKSIPQFFFSWLMRFSRKWIIFKCCPDFIKKVNIERYLLRRYKVINVNFTVKIKVHYFWSRWISKQIYPSKQSLKCVDSKNRLAHVDLP